MSHGLDDVLHDFQLRVLGEELTRVNGLPIEQRRAYVRTLWESRVKRAASSGETFGETELGQSKNQFYRDA